MPGPTRRRFLAQCATGGALLCTGSKSLFAAKRAPSLHFPSEPRERIAIASYPFRNFIAGEENKSSHPIDLKDFAAHVIEEFNINKIEPWTGHFPSTDPKYLDQFRAVLEKAKAMVVNMAVDGEHSPYAVDRGERERAIALWRKAVAAGDTLAYNEPADWYYPMRESLGGALLRDGKPVEAEGVFRRDLELNPRSGRSLCGLWQSLVAQKKDADAAWVKRQFDAAWARADVKLTVGNL